MKDEDDSNRRVRCSPCKTNAITIGEDETRLERRSKYNERRRQPQLARNMLAVKDEVDLEELCLLLFRQLSRLSWVIERDGECGRHVLELQ